MCSIALAKKQKPMNKIVLICIAMAVAFTSCIKEKEDVVLLSRYHFLENPDNLELMEVPNWETATMVANIKKNDSTTTTDTIYTYTTKAGVAYISNEGAEYRIMATNQYGKLEDNAPAYRVAVYDDNNKLVCYGQVNPSGYSVSGQWKTQNQNFFVDHGFPYQSTV